MGRKGVLFFQFMYNQKHNQILRNANVCLWLFFLQLLVNGVQELREAALLSAFLLATDSPRCDAEDGVHFLVQVGKAETRWSAVLELPDAALLIKNLEKLRQIKF